MKATRVQREAKRVSDESRWALEAMVRKHGYQAVIRELQMLAEADAKAMKIREEDDDPMWEVHSGLEIALREAVRFDK